MKKYVFTIRDDVCLANGKDVEATELLGKMKLWGEVEDYDRSISGVKAEYQATVDNLTTQLSAIKDQELTADEIEIVLAYRACKTTISDRFLRRINALEGELSDIKTEEQVRLEKIMAILNN